MSGPTQRMGTTHLCIKWCNSTSWNVFPGLNPQSVTLVLFHILLSSSCICCITLHLFLLAPSCIKLFDCFRMKSMFHSCVQQPFTDWHWHIAPQVKTIDYVLTGTLKNSCFSIHIHHQQICLSHLLFLSFLLLSFCVHFILSVPRVIPSLHGRALCFHSFSILIRRFVRGVTIRRFRGQINSCQEGLVPRERDWERGGL